ncbi:hypothetical protein [Pseudomonas gingeri]|uniref:hypothetical protein n=1 Tax=Pseudomonas gingeri TaxID=117681 RepID=UPI0015C055B7|nr:hypothetical protein [Pseudomonas gingeri]NWD49019.1 hypothetical protein [Pseudomonas gingeri]
MTELASSSVHDLFGKEVVVRELSVAAIRTLFANSSDDAIGGSLFEDVRLSDIPTFTSLTNEELEALSPSQIRRVIELCKEKNPDFFAMLARFHSRLARP